MSPHDLEPAGIDPDRPTAARIYDYWLGGAHNFAADRRAAEQIMAVYPGVPLKAHANRAFLRRAVQYLAHTGVRQFLDIGSGIPTVGHVHEVARQSAPDAKVVYVDIDPVAIAHSRDILDGDHRTAAIQEDLRRPEQILAHPDVQRLFDFEQPIAVLLVAILHFVPDRYDPAGIIARLLDPLAPGSHLVISHATDDGPEDSTAITHVYRSSGIEFTLRTRQEVAALFAGCDLVPPGLTWVPLWHTESEHDTYAQDPTISEMYAAVGRKR